METKSASGRMVVAQRGVIPPPKHYADSAWFKYILSCCAATTAEMVTYPLDLTKTRLQIQGEKGLNGNGVATVPYRGLARTGVGIVQEEGLLKLWQGVTPAVYRHLIYSGTRMVLYEKVRDHLFTTRPDGTRPVWQAIVGGILVGGIAQFLASPADLIKVQMQMEGRRRFEGKPPRIHSASEAFVKIYAAGGLRGLWKGCMPNVYRSAFVNLGDLTTYDSVKRYFMGSWGLSDSYWTHALSSALSGLVSAILGCPADVIKARIMNQPVDHKQSLKVQKDLKDCKAVECARVWRTTRDRRGLLYKNSLDCLMKTVRNEGFWALYKGFVPCWLRMGPWSLTFWLTYEQIRNACGTSAF
ncbi:mitochondrial uncoupling protein 4-like isoform X2 [Scylla paramamosain]|uniref:mitochondrial uncoupling protein 4-like isoform X2 n=1 Tax=Scylla paramamosain TaxID=85552 RepID=UPI003083490C